MSKMHQYEGNRPKDLILLYKMARMPWMLFFLMFVVVSIGCAVLYSASGGDFNPWAARQFTRFAVGIPVMLLIAMIDIRFWFKISYVLYVFGIGLLIAVMFFGVEGGLGAQRWLNIGGFKFQPSELMKVFLVLALARYYHVLHMNNVKKWWSLIVPLMMIGVAVILILKQPNLGTAAIVALLGAILLFLAGVSWKLFFVGIVAVVIMVPVAWNFVMHDYQKQRVITFLDPESDPLGAGYNIIQSKIAIGSGGFWGKGFVNGTQSQLAFVPERQTDFIFSIYAEEFGFVGGVFLIALYALILIYALMISIRCENTYARIMSMGMASILFIHVFVNMGMVMGLLPVVGVPLPLLSYGGSSMLATQIAFGFIFNASAHRIIKLRKSSKYGEEG